MNNKITIFFLVVLYAIVNYFLNVYNLKIVDDTLCLVKNMGEMVKNDDYIIMQINIHSNDFLWLYVYSNFHLFLISFYLQYRLHLLLNQKIYMNVLLFTLVTLFLTRTFSYYFGQSDNHTVKWIGSNIFSRADITYKFLFQFPTLPFLIYIFNKNLADKIKNR
ncbi:MAG: hypothetical protein NTU43_03845 [Bacteroidetes bacterium]|nr:hypothetical protein [Bacteroidota bacterium]